MFNRFLKFVFILIVTGFIGTGCSSGGGDDNFAQDDNIPAGTTVNPVIFGADDSANNPRIIKYNVTNGNIQNLPINNLANPYGICIDDENKKLYWTDYGTDKIQRSNLDGSNVEDIVTSGLEMPAGIALDIENEKIYWADYGSQNIRRCNFNGSSVEELISSPEVISPIGIDLDLTNGHIYFSDEGSYKIQRSNLDGSGLIDIATNLSIPHGIVYSSESGKLFWTNYVEDGSVQSIDLDGSNLTTIVNTGLNYAMGIVLDRISNKIYFSDEGSQIKRANTDGSNLEEMFQEGCVPFIAIMLNIENEDNEDNEDNNHSDIDDERR